MRCPINMPVPDMHHRWLTSWYFRKGKRYGVVNHASTIQPFQILVQYSLGLLHSCTSMSFPIIPISFAQYATFGDQPCESLERMKSVVISMRSPFNLSKCVLDFPTPRTSDFWRKRRRLMIWHFICESSKETGSVATFWRGGRMPTMTSWSHSFPVVDWVTNSMPTLTSVGGPSSNGFYHRGPP